LVKSKKLYFGWKYPEEGMVVDFEIKSERIFKYVRGELREKKF
jgi:hypothetical protein